MRKYQANMPSNLPEIYTTLSNTDLGSVIFEVQNYLHFLKTLNDTQAVKLVKARHKTGRSGRCLGSRLQTQMSPVSSIWSWLLTDFDTPPHPTNGGAVVRAKGYLTVEYSTVPPKSEFRLILQRRGNDWRINKG